MAAPDPDHAFFRQGRLQAMGQLVQEGLGHPMPLIAHDGVDPLQHDEQHPRLDTVSLPLAKRCRECAPIGQVRHRVGAGEPLQRLGALGHQPLQHAGLLATPLIAALVAQGVVNACQHFLMVERLGQEITHAHGQRPLTGLVVDLSGQHDGGRHLRAEGRLKGLEHPVTIQVGHADIQQQQVGRLCPAVGEHVARIGEAGDVLVAVIFQQVLKQLDVNRMVIHDQQALVIEGGIRRHPSFLPVKRGDGRGSPRTTSGREAWSGNHRIPPPGRA